MRCAYTEETGRGGLLAGDHTGRHRIRPRTHFMRGRTLGADHGCSTSIRSQSSRNFPRVHRETAHPVAHLGCRGLIPYLFHLKLDPEVARLADDPVDRRDPSTSIGHHNFSRSQWKSFRYNKSGILARRCEDLRLDSTDCDSDVPSAKTPALDVRRSRSGFRTLRLNPIDCDGLLRRTLADFLRAARTRNAEQRKHN